MMMRIINPHLKHPWIANPRGQNFEKPFLKNVHINNSRITVTPTKYVFASFSMFIKRSEEINTPPNRINDNKIEVAFINI